MTFPHPTTGKELTITAPLDDAFQQMLTHLGWDK